MVTRTLFNVTSFVYCLFFFRVPMTCTVSSQSVNGWSFTLQVTRCFKDYCPGQIEHYKMYMKFQLLPRNCMYLYDMKKKIKIRFHQESKSWRFKCGVIHKLLNQQFALVSFFCSKNFYTFKTFLHLLKYFKSVKVCRTKKTLVQIVGLITYILIYCTV